MLDWYTRFYQAIATSQAYGEHCLRLYGRDLGQHGFADMHQMARLLHVAAIKAGQSVLDLGCGHGRIAEWISDETGARVTGVDNVPLAIEQARERTREKTGRLSFILAGMDSLELPAASFDVILAVDSLYFTNLVRTLRGLLPLCKPGGVMACLYSQGADPEHPLEVFDRGTLPPDKTPLGAALVELGVSFCTWDLTEEDRQHALLKKVVAADLRAAWEAEGNAFLYQNRLGEAEGVLSAIAAGAHKRYLYLATPS